MHPVARDSRFFAALLTLVFVTAVPSIGRAQQPVGDLIFYNSWFDRLAIGHITREGQFQSTFDSLSWGNWFPRGANNTLVANTSNGAMVYQPDTGLAYTFRVSPGGDRDPGTSYYGVFPPGWDVLVANGQYMFWYNRSVGWAAIGYLDQLGYYRQTAFYTLAQLQGAWTSVVFTDNNIVLYNYHTAEALVGAIRYNGTLVFTHRSNLIVGCDELQGIGQRVLCYNKTTGYVGIGDISRLGQLRLTDVPFVGSNFTRLVKQGDHAVFFREGSGLTKIGYVSHEGLFVPTSESTVIQDVPGWGGITPSTVVSTGAALLFYDNVFGRASAARIDRDGQLLVTQSSFALTQYYTNLLSTTR